MNVSVYNGCGNDFVIVDYQADTDYSQLAQDLCQDERFNTDGLIAVKQGVLEMIFYNRDGSRAPMCGNGIRCFAKYVWDKKIVSELTFPVLTLAGSLDVKITNLSPFTCEVDMGVAIYGNDLIEAADNEGFINRQVELSSGPVTVTSLFLGTIHTVVFVDDAIKELTLTRGEELCHHPLFKAQTNVNFVQVLSPTELIVRTFERGVGWTLACGTGCCAAFSVARDQGFLTPDTETTVYLETGALKIRGAQEVTMTGPAVFEKELTVI